MSHPVKAWKKEELCKHHLSRMNTVIHFVYLKLSAIPKWHISSHWKFSRMFVRTDVNKISISVSPVEKNSFLNLFLSQCIRWCMILWSASSMSQFEISSSAIVFSMFVLNFRMVFKTIQLSNYRWWLVYKANCAYFWNFFRTCHKSL